jgi:hypothetical protein
MVRGVNHPAVEWLSTVGPLLVPLVLSWLEQRGTRRELRLLRHELRNVEQTHMTKLIALEIRVQRLEEVKAA